MALEEGSFYVGSGLVEPAPLRIGQGESIQRLEPQVMRILLFLAARAPKVVSREEILEEVWEGRAVVEETVTRAISLLRQAFGDDAKRSRYIETIPTQGYRLIAAVKQISKADTGEVCDQSTQQWRLPRAMRWLLAALALVLLTALTIRLSMSSPDVVDMAEPRPAIAVLPFENLSGEAKDLYLSDGLTDEMIHQLAGIGGLRVVSRTSSMQFR